MDKVTCPICNKSFKSLMSHINFIHKMNINEFLKKHPETKLVSENTKKATSASCIEAGCGLSNRGRKVSDEEKKMRSELSYGKNNPFYGKSHSDISKNKMKENHADFKGDKNPFKIWIDSHPEELPNLIKRGKESFEKLKSDPIKYAERVFKLSESMAKAHLDGKLSSYGRGHKSGYYLSEKFSKNFFYRSSYELNFLKICDNNNSVNELKACDFYIQYVHPDGYNKNYIPDFILNNLYLIEIKPKSLLNLPVNINKFKFAHDYCLLNNLELVILTESELEEFKNTSLYVNDFLATKKYLKG